MTTTTSSPYLDTWAGAAPRPSASSGIARHTGTAGTSGDLDTCRRALDRAARGQGAAVVVRGEAGIGKSTLLRSVADGAAGSGWRVLRVSGGDARARRAFGAFEPLADELLDLAAGLPDLLRTALRRALRGDPAPDPLSTYAALRQVLASAAQRGPVLVVVDDCHLLDTASARAVTFVTNRLPGTAVAVLAATAVDVCDPFDGCEITEVPLSGLDQHRAAHLLASRHPGLAAVVRTAVISAAQGNPLALLSLSDALTPAQRDGGTPLPDPLPAGSLLDGRLGGLFRSLPLPTRDLLALLALTEAGMSTVELAHAAERLGTGPDALDPAERAGLVRGDRTVRFTRRFFRTLAYSTASPAARRWAHTAWTDLGLARWGTSAGDGAHAARGTDGVTRFDRLARAAAARGQWSAALRAWQRAADAGSDPAGRSRGYAAAATMALRCGRPGLAMALCRQAQGGREPALTRTVSMVQASAGFDTAFTAETNRAALSSALTHGQVLGSDGREWAAFQSALLGSLTHRPEPARQALDWLSARPVPSAALRTAVLAHLDPVGRLSEIRSGLAEATGAADAGLARANARELTWLADAAWRIDDIALSEHLTAAALRRGGPEDRTHLSHASALQVALMVAAGRWSEVHTVVPARLREAEREGLTRYGVSLKAQLLLVCAFQGRAGQAAELLADVRRWARTYDSPHHGRIASYAAYLLAGSGTAAAGGGSDAPPPPGPLSDVVARYAYVDTVRAALARGRTTLARAQAARASLHGLEAFSADMRLAVRHGRALLAAHDGRNDTGALFRSAAEAATAASRPFARGRLALDHGIWLKRQRETAGARGQLRYAYDLFTRLGATPWQESARAELRAVGVSLPGPGAVAQVDPGRPALTAHELRIVRMAARGLSNPEIADQLAISPRTVASHLYKVFPRLGTSSRRELDRALQELGDHT
ncbi:AAA family ATPase [Streptomyces sp. NPDC017673]|uniref:AAA family ATPase n=1 Tax=unclassified Streptomyces TaxID=2593676 RepID=UPI0037BDAB32